MHFRRQRVTAFTPVVGGWLKPEALVSFFAIANIPFFYHE
jgi:hypothetical protein